jgi:hypothetical protein
MPRREHIVLLFRRPLICVIGKQKELQLYLQLGLKGVIHRAAARDSDNVTG